MIARLSAAALILAAAACTPVPSPDTAVLPPFAFGTNQDNATAAIGISSWALADSGRTRNDPIDAARALAGVDFLAGELSSNPRWTGLSPLIKRQMLIARVEIRQTIGVMPGARSQDVVGGLLRAASAMAAGDSSGAQAALSGPVFTLGPRQTYNRLAALPFLTAANVATQRVNGSLNGFGDETCPGC